MPARGSVRPAARALRLASVVALAAPGVAAAHPEHYGQVAFVELLPERVTVEVRGSPGVRVAEALAAHVDADADGQITGAEGAAYARELLEALTLTIDARPVALAIESVSVPDRPTFTSGEAELRVVASAALTLAPGRHAVRFANGHAPAPTQYTTVATTRGAAVRLGRPRRDASGARLELEVEVAAESGSGMKTSEVSAPRDGPVEGAAGASPTGARRRVPVELVVGALGVGVGWVVERRRVRRVDARA